MKTGLGSLVGLYEEVASLADTIKKMAPRVSLSDDVLHYVKRVVTARQSRPLAHTEELLSELSSLTTCLTLDTALYRLIEGLLQYPDWDVHVLTKGYQLVNGLVSPLPGTRFLDSNFPNQAVEIITNSSQWKNIFKCIGMKCFCTILLHFAVFVPLDTNPTIHIQISGYSLASNMSKLILPATRPITIKPTKTLDLNHPSVRISLLKKCNISISHICYGCKLALSPGNIISYQSKPPVTESEVKDLSLAIFNDTKSKSRACIKRIHKISEAIDLLRLIKKHKTVSYRELLKKALSTTAHDVDEGNVASLIAQYTPLNEVKRFVVSALLQVVPGAAWGSKRNKRLVIKAVLEVLSLHSHETRSISHLTRGIKISEYDWVSSGAHSHTHVPQSQSLSNELMALLWIKWLIEGFVLPLISKYFYVTERGGSTRNIMFFYTKDVWSRIVLLGIKNLTDKQILKPLKESEVSFLTRQSRTLGVSLLRFLPKTESLRPIVNLKTVPKGEGRGEGGDNPQSINSKLINILHVLKYESLNKVGCSMLGFNEFHKRWKHFLERKTVSLNNSWYMISVDIMSCFDTVLSDHLLVLLRRVLTQDQYYIRGYYAVKVRNGNIKTYYKRCATEAVMVPFVDIANRVSSSHHDVILSDAMSVTLLSRDTILHTLECHLKNNIVKVNGQYYIQKQGIPQGSVLSTLLCCIYYADMEARHISPVLRNEGFLVRLVDDFFYVTDKIDLVIHFDTLMTRGFSDYNCYINKSKTKRNYLITDDGKVSKCVDLEWFPWCGLLINTSSLQLSVDNTRYKKIRDCLTINSSSVPLQTLSVQLIQTLSLKCVPHLLDSQCLYDGTVLLNLYLNFILSAMKFHCHTRDYVRVHGFQTNSKGTASAVMRIFMSSVRQFDHQAKSICKRAGGVYSIPLLVCNWLSLKAFYTVFKRKQSLYGTLLLLIRKALQRIHESLDEDYIELLLDTVESSSNNPVFSIAY